MYLLHEATVKNFDGIIDVTVHIITEKDGLPIERKGYVYHIRSDWAYQKFLTFYRKGKKFHGRALAYLNNFKIKEERERNGRREDEEAYQKSK